MNEKVNGFDLAALDTSRGAEEGYTLTLVHPKTGEATPVTITVLGADSETFRDKQREILRRRAERMNRTRKLTVAPEEAEADSLELLVAVISGWSGMTLDGAELPFSGENARMVLRRFGWIREQVDQAVSDRANFLPRSASS